MTSEKNKYVSLFTKFVNNNERMVKEIQNNASVITDNTTQLDSLLEDLDLGYIKVFLPPKNTCLESWKRWKKYLETFDLNIFSENDIYNLAFDYDVLNNDEYWKLLKNRKFISENILFSLIRNLHYYWTDLNNFNKVIKDAEQYLKSINTDKKLITQWKKNPEVILGTQSITLEKILLHAINHNIINLPTLYNNKLYEIQKNDLVANIIQYEYLSEIIQTKTFIEQINYFFELCIEFLNYSIKPEFRNGDERTVSQSLKQKRDSLLAELIVKIDSISRYDEEYKFKLIEYVLNCAIYGDPRLKEWADYKYAHAMDIFKMWLNERDIEFFFENLIDNDPHNRKGFWLNYTKKIQSAVFVLGNDVEVNRKNYDQIKKFKEISPKNFYKIGDERNTVKSNIFMLNMGSIVVVEFTEINNACFVYYSDDYQRELNPLLQAKSTRAKLKLSSFKDNDLCLERFTHDQWGTWQKNMKIFLDRHI